MKRRSLGILALSAVITAGLVTACGPHRSYAPYDTVATLEDEQYNVSRLPPYTLQVADRLTVKFQRNPELDQELIVRPDGRISLPFIDEVQCAGLTPDELKAELERRYAGELAAPDITVALSEFGGNRVFVDGEVKTPGMLQLTAGMTMLDAIASSGGFLPRGHLEQVILIRRDENGKPVGHSVDLKKVAVGREAAGDVLLQPFDIVYVPRTKIGDAGIWVEQYITDMLPIRLRLSIPLGLWI
jgi:protein involved in polysaccharide export with SLBB domain